MSTHPEEKAVPLPLKTLLESYEISEVLGQGGFGISYLAYDTRLERRVVLKEHYPLGLCYRRPGTATVMAADDALYRHSLNGFLREARILAALRHNGIVGVHDIFPACNTAYIVLEYVEGSNLQQRAAQSPYSTAELRAILTDILHTLSYLHAKGMLHRDIKPSNIMQLAEGKTVLIDFGAALEELPDHTITTMASPLYSPPEQFHDHRKLGPHSDLFALGRTILSLLPEDEEDDLQLLSSLRKAVEYNIDDRFRNAEEWLAALESPPRKQATSRPRSMLPYAAGGLLFVGGVITAYSLYPQAEQLPPPAVTTPAPPTAPKIDPAIQQQHIEAYRNEFATRSKQIYNTYQLSLMSISGKYINQKDAEDKREQEFQQAADAYRTELEALHTELAQKYGISLSPLKEADLNASPPFNTYTAPAN